MLKVVQRPNKIEDSTLLEETLETLGVDTRLQSVWKRIGCRYMCWSKKGKQGICSARGIVGLSRHGTGLSASSLFWRQSQETPVGECRSEA